MTENILGAVKVMRPALFRLVQETLFFIQNRIIVAKKVKGLGYFGGGIGAVITVVHQILLDILERTRIKEILFLILMLNPLTNSIIMVCVWICNNFTTFPTLRNLQMLPQ